MERQPVAVIGGGLAGMAAAARLAKLGHPVELFEAYGVLGGGWAPYELEAGVLVDDAPAILGFPAPWRDLFRKSGRPLEAELTRLGYALVPAEPPKLIFADGFTLILPTDRGEQYAAMRRGYGESVARRWRELLDRLDDVWQALRPLGLESELTARRLDRAVRRQLMPRRTLADLAADLGHPHLAALVRGSAYRCGSVPEDTPAMMAVEHAISRTFGRWQIQRTGDPAAAGTGRTSVLVEALAGRLALRKVAIHTQTPVIGVEIDGGRVTGVRTQNAHHVAAAVVCTADPWQTVDSLLREDVARAMRRRVRRLKPAAAPMISHALGNEEVAGVTETVSYTAQGVPTITYRRPAREQSITSVHDFRSTKPSSSSGVGWQGFRTFLRRPPITTEVAGLFLAGPSSPAGAAPSAVVLSSALAAGGCQNYLLSLSQQG